MAALLAERDRLLAQRARAPQHHNAARLAQVPSEIAVLAVANRPPPPDDVAHWA